MAGTKSGGQKSAKSNIARHGKDFYRRIGALGGKATDPRKRNFALDPQLASRAGKIGGKISRPFTVHPELRKHPKP